MRGKTLHNYLAMEAERILRNEGFETSQECPEELSNGRIDFIDILARKNNFAVCVEIETTPRYVLTNAAKSQELGLPLMVIVPNRKVKKAVEKRLSSVDLRPGGMDIYLLLLSQLRQGLTNCFP